MEISINKQSGQGPLDFFTSPGNDLWKADNSSLQAKTRGIQYRNSMDLDDRASRRDVLEWGRAVRVESAGAEWVKVKCSEAVGPNHVRF